MIRATEETLSADQLSQNATELVERVRDTKEPIYVTVNGERAAVLQDIQTFEMLNEPSSDDIAESARIIRERLADLDSPEKWLSHEEMTAKVRDHISKRLRTS